jgi:hypothetical protein
MASLGFEFYKQKVGRDSGVVQSSTQQEEKIHCPSSKCMSRGGKISSFLLKQSQGGG